MSTRQAPEGGQLTLVRERARRAVRAARTSPPAPPAATLPVARVAVDLPLAHLDRPFDYLVTEPQSAVAVPGARVRVRFAGRELDGYVLERRAEATHEGRLTRLSRVVSAEPVLTPAIAALARQVADWWAGTLADVLRLAVPPRHARVEREPRAAPGEPPVLRAAPDAGPWSRYPGGAGFLARLREGAGPRAAWTARPGEDWPRALAVAVHAMLSTGRGALVVVPDGRDVQRVDGALAEQLGAGHHVALTAELGPAERYRRWLAVRRGEVRAVVGTRAATYAPVGDLGLVAVWDDGDDLHAEPHAPYAHSRDVLLLRAARESTACIVGGFLRTAEAALLVQTGWAGSLGAERADVRRAAPRITVAGDDAELARDPAAASARLPSVAWRTARDALHLGPVLVQVPRRGYLPALACQRCREPARCASCAGPLGLGAASAPPRCRWCGRADPQRRCPGCGGTALRALAVGSTRTAEELGRAFPSMPVRTSGREAVLATVPDRPALVVATPGAEPVAGGGYAAALLLDGAALLSRPDLRAGEEALRRWMGAAALVRPASDGGVVVLLADPALRPVQAFVRWDPAGHAERELAERREIGFPPEARVATLTGEPAAVADLLATLRLPEGAKVLGPVPVAGRTHGGGPAPPAKTAPLAGTVPVDEAPHERVLVRVPRARGADLTAALRAAQGVRSARKAPHVRVQVNPLDVG